MWKLFSVFFCTGLFRNAVLEKYLVYNYLNDELFNLNETPGGNTRKEWYLLPHPEMVTPPKIPFLPFFVGYEGAPAHTSERINLVRDVVKLAEKIAEEIRNPDQITRQHTLTSFNTMVHLLKTASEDQVSSITSQLFVKLKPGVDSFRYTSWIVLRDAVVHAGTGPSIISLQKWIRDEYVYGEEASQLISTITNTAEYPTEEFMRVFFALVKNADTYKQIYVNSSSVLAFSSLIKKVYVCHKSMVKRFPVYSFGRLLPKTSKALEYVYLPYLFNKLKNAIEEADSHKIQVYIRALGNTAHPKILTIFGPYLNGENKISDFQRLLMVSSLDAMTLVHPNLVRTVLYRIYLNSGETSEIRTEAVALLMRTNPPVEILQRMAEATNFDNSDHINAAVKTAIESASLVDTGDELARKSKEAVNLLKDTNYGLHYSSNYIRSFNSNENLGYKLRWNHIQSAGSILPSSFFFTLRPNLGGFTQRAYKYSWMTSSVDSLANLLSKQIVPHTAFPNADSTWTPENIAKMLGMEYQDQKQVEGNFYTTLHGARRFITFDNHTVEELPRLVKFASSAFRIGDSFNYTKLYNQISLRFAFPTAIGLPFVFTIENPTILSIVGDARMNSYPDLANGSPEKINLPQYLNWTTDFTALFSSKTESKLGFITPFNHQHYIAGYDTNSHINLPLRVKGDVDVGNNKIWLKLQPLYANKYQKLAELSTMAYTTKYDILDLIPPQLDDNTKIIRIRPIKKGDFTVGQHMTGFAFDFKGETMQRRPNFPLFFQSFKQHDLISALMYYEKRSSIEPYTNYSIYFNPSNTSAKSVKIVLNYADVKEYAASERSIDPLSNDAITTASAGEHKKRVEELLKRSTAEMRDSYAQAIDISAEFEGNKSSVMTIAGAYARSHVSEKARYLLYISRVPATKTQNTKPLQIALDVRAKLPNVPLGNFQEAVKSDPTSAIVARLNFGEKASNGAEVLIKGQVEKSPERINYLLNLPISTQCFKEMNSSNYLQQACHNVTTRANFMDHIYFRIDYQDVADSWKKTCHDLYSLMRYFASSYIKENVINQTNPSGRIEFDAVFSPELNSFNATLLTPVMTSELNNVGVNRYFQPALIMHPHYTIWDRIYERIIFSQNSPRCVADNSHAVTFDNKTYPMFIGHCWHTLFHFRSESRPEIVNTTWTKGYEDDVNVLVRKTQEKERDLMIILGENVIRFHTDSGTPTGYFVANDQRYDLSEVVVGHFEDKSGKTLIQAYKLPTGNMRIFTPVHGLVIFYDGFRVEIQTPSRYRGKVRGLCGTFDGETSTDFTSPQNCILKNPLEFVATYAIADGTCEEQVKEFRRKALSGPCFKQSISPTTVVKTNTYESIIIQYNLQPKKHKRP